MLTNKEVDAWTKRMDGFRAKLKALPSTLPADEHCRASGGT